MLKSMYWPDRVILWKLWGKICLQAHSDRCQNSDPRGCRTEVSIPLLAISWGHSQQVGVIVISWHMVSSTFKVSYRASPHIDSLSHLELL